MGAYEINKNNQENKQERLFVKPRTWIDGYLKAKRKQTGHVLTQADREKGAKTKSLKKARAVKTNALKHGRDAKDPEITELITPTPAEKLLGITASDKLRQLRKFNKMFGAADKMEYLYGLQEMLGNMVLEAVDRRDKGQSHSHIWKDFGKLSIELSDRLFGRPIDTQINVQQNTTVVSGKLSFEDLHKQIIQRAEVSEEWKEAEE